jgi:hypothetical protein
MEEEGEDVMDARLLDLFANSHPRPEARHETLEAVPHQARIIIFYIYIHKNQDNAGFFRMQLRALRPTQRKNPKCKEGNPQMRLKSTNMTDSMVQPHEIDYYWRCF